MDLEFASSAFIKLLYGFGPIKSDSLKYNSTPAPAFAGDPESQLPPTLTPRTLSPVKALTANWATPPSRYVNLPFQSTAKQEFSFFCTVKFKSTPLTLPTPAPLLKDTRPAHDALLSFLQFDGTGGFPVWVVRQAALGIATCLYKQKPAACAAGFLFCVFNTEVPSVVPMDYSSAAMNCATFWLAWVIASSTAT